MSRTGDASASSITTTDRAGRTETLTEGRATRAVIDLDALAGNLRCFRALVTPRTGVMAVVKANGYGHGAVMVAQTAVEAGASHLGVATVDEGVALRVAGLRAPILVLGPVDRSEVAHALRNELALTVADADFVDHVAQTAGILNLPRPGSVHLKVDTGMRRFGVMPEAARTVARRARAQAGLSLDGVFTHFACADEADDHFTAEQAGLFERALADLRADGIEPPLVHAANSAATLRSRRYDYDLVRIGISLYGLPPSVEVALPAALRPVMSIRSRVARIVELAPGDGVSYGSTYRAAGHERAALVPIGYGDGYRRGLSGQAWMGIGGVKAPVRGRVCMDQMVVGVAAGLNVRVGDEVTVVGPPETGAPGMAELADLSGTISYEIATGISARVPRWYVRGGRIVAIEDLRGLRMATDDSQA